MRAAAIHGDRSQKQREKALDLFVRGAVDALVATDVAARGIHVDGVNAVVHFDPPADAKDYVHRSGRTARAGATGVVVSFVTPDKAAAVKRLQRHLDVPLGTTAPELAAITAVVGTPTPRTHGRDRAPGGVPGGGSGSIPGGRPDAGRRRGNQQGKPWKPRPEPDRWEARWRRITPRTGTRGGPGAPGRTEPAGQGGQGVVVGPEGP